MNDDDSDGMPDWLPLDDRDPVAFERALRDLAEEAIASTLAEVKAWLLEDVTITDLDFAVCMRQAERAMRTAADLGMQQILQRRQTH